MPQLRPLTRKPSTGSSHEHVVLVDAVAGDTAVVVRGLPAQSEGRLRLLRDLEPGGLRGRPSVRGGRARSYEELQVARDVFCARGAARKRGREWRSSLPPDGASPRFARKCFLPRGAMASIRPAGDPRGHGAPRDSRGGRPRGRPRRTAQVSAQRREMIPRAHRGCLDARSGKRCRPSGIIDSLRRPRKVGCHDAKPGPLGRSAPVAELAGDGVAGSR